MFLYLTYHSLPSTSSDQWGSERQDLLLKNSDKPTFSLNNTFKTIAFGDSPALYSFPCLLLTVKLENSAPLLAFCIGLQPFLRKSGWKCRQSISEQIFSLRVGSWDCQFSVWPRGGDSSCSYYKLVDPVKRDAANSLIIFQGPQL